MRSMSIRWVLCMGTLFLAAMPARAAVILFKNTNQSFTDTNRLQQTTDRLACDFTTGSTSTLVQSTTLTMFCNNLANATSHNFTVKIQADNSGTPGSVVGTFNTFSLNTAQSVQNGFATTSGISLAANTTYWEVLQINETPTSEIVGWYRTTSQSADAGSLYSIVPATQVLFSSNSGSTWSNVYTGNSLFRFDGLAPEPAFALPLCAMAALLRRRRVGRHGAQ